MRQKTTLARELESDETESRTLDDDTFREAAENYTGSAVEKKDFNHMRWFQKNLATKQTFIGVILYTGEFPASFGNNLWAVPFGLLWS